MLDMAFKELGRHKRRTFLTALGIAIGILLVTALSSFAEGINASINQQLGYLSGMIVVIQEDTGWASIQSSEIDESLGDEILDTISGVERISGMLMGSVPGVGGIFSMDPEDLDMFDLEVDFQEGRIMEDDTLEIVVGSRLAEVKGYDVGDTIEMRGKRYDVVGIPEETGTEEDTGILAGLQTGQEILKKEDKVTMFVIKPASIDDAKLIADEINRIYDKVRAGTEEDARREAEEFSSNISAMTFGMGSIAAIIAGLGIMNVMFMSVRERRREIGTMKALGATNYQVLTEIVTEAVIMALAGALIGIALSYLAVDAINTELGAAGVAKITPGLLISVTLFALFLGVLGGIIPARQAAHLQPAVVLRYE